ncbi:mitotic spindle assembly checkpoint protein MAD2B isoform X2 [Teleopsis dalmanni]|uniref:mitotic spindle assembly checkpoint protein MAD2B isoform X2 n=1 Tax=Teleopsis dalmanni TaxID=139649 RepID=UPI0018CEE929|nr:mitotic spindle assembly checkpoint protein MAD2B isoform X2 [Teleopsis dalmanni]
MDSEIHTDIFTEALEVFLNQILYLRRVYPSQIFKKRRIYNTPIFISIYPPLNEYLIKVLQMVRELHCNGVLTRVDLLLYKNENEIHERYTFNFRKHTPEDLLDLPQNDEFLIKYEEILRTSLYTMAERLKSLESLPQDIRFKVFFHTTQECFIRFSQNPQYQFNLGISMGNRFV